MDMNFFQWMRNGVKQAVLHGVSDAVEQIGLPPETEESNSHQSLAFLKNAKSITKSNKANSRKRLGKSLKEIEVETSK